MHLSKGFSLTKKYYPLVLLAVVLDLFNLRDISQRFQELHFKLTIPSAVPSLTQVLGDLEPAAGGLNINLQVPFMGATAFLIFLAFLVLGAYLKGGFLGVVFEGVKGGEVNKDIFFSYASRYISRFLIQLVIILAAVAFFGLLLVGLGPLALIFVLVLLAAFLFLVFWDYIIIAQDMGVVDAAERSWRVVSSNLGQVLLFILPIIFFTTIISFISNFLVLTPLVLIAMIGYAFWGTQVVFSMMSFYLNLEDEEGSKQI